MKPEAGEWPIPMRFSRDRAGSRQATGPKQLLTLRQPGSHPFAPSFRWDPSPRRKCESPLTGSRENPVVPQSAAQACQRINEGGRGLLRVPGPVLPGQGVPLGGEVPQPGSRVDPQRQARGALGTLAFPALGLVAAKELLDVAEGVLDAPAPCVVLRDPFWSAINVGGEEEIIQLVAFGVPDDDQQDEVVGQQPVPQDTTRENQPLGFLAPQDRKSVV